MKKIKRIIATLMICVFMLPVTTFAAKPVEEKTEVQEETRATNMFQETVAVTSSLTTTGQVVQLSGNRVMVSVRMFNIANDPTSLTITLQRRGLFGFKEIKTETVPLSTNVQDVFYGQEIESGDEYRFLYRLNGGAGSYAEVSLGVATYN